jgi:hypothetical protein
MCNENKVEDMLKYMGYNPTLNLVAVQVARRGYSRAPMKTKTVVAKSMTA